MRIRWWLCLFGGPWVYSYEPCSAPTPAAGSKCCLCERTIPCCCRRLHAISVPEGLVTHHCYPQWPGQSQSTPAVCYVKILVLKCLMLVRSCARALVHANALRQNTSVQPCTLVEHRDSMYSQSDRLRGAPTLCAHPRSLPALLHLTPALHKRLIGCFLKRQEAVLQSHTDPGNSGRLSAVRLESRSASLAHSQN